MQKFLQLIKGNKTLIWTLVTGVVGYLWTSWYISQNEVWAIVTVLALLGKLASKYTK